MNIAHFYFVRSVTLAECAEIIVLLKITSFGQNSLPVKICISARHAIVKILSQLMNINFETGTFPDTLKCAQIMPQSNPGTQKLL